MILRTATGRTALCVSSQIGCAAACAFCATGHMGIARDLTSDEILDQLLLANRHLRPEGRRVRNLVFMGMGEPLHNESNVHAALSTLLNPVAFDHPASRILLSTVGVPDPWIRTAETFPTINYALSLHSAIGEQRAKIIPLAKRYSLEQIRDAIGELNRLQPAKTAVMVEYLMLDRFNDSMEDALALIDWLDGLRVHVNLIPFNPIAQAPDLRSSPREVIKRFAERIKANGFPTTIRYSLGKDIDAACGQLVIDENQALARELSAASRS
ncbi:MAG: radical SAM protein [Planctomycetota bacterium]